MARDSACIPREMCDFTAPALIPIASAISLSFRSIQ